MAKNRYLPFGYIMDHGQVSVNPQEADAVRVAFEEYLTGASYSDIAEQFTRSDIRYHVDSDKWNKHMIKRILENEKYCGDKKYAAIIERDIFDATASLRESKRVDVKPKQRDKETVTLAPSIVNLNPPESITVTRMERQIARTIHDPAGDMEHALALIYECAQERFALYLDAYKTQTLTTKCDS